MIRSLLARLVGGPLARAALLLLLLTGPASAQGMDLGVTLVPPDGEEAASYFQYRLAPGESREDRVLVRNGADTVRRVVVYAADAFSTPDGGLAGPTQEAAPQAVGTWIRLSKSELVLEPGEQEEFRVTLRVPADAAPGDHFGFVFVQAREEQVQQVPGTGQAAFSVRMQTRFGITLWERVPGEHLAALEVEPVQKVITDGLLSLHVRLRNRGNLFLKPAAAWELVGPDGTRVQSSDLAPLGYLLPGSDMLLRIPLQTDVPLVLGTYRLALRVQDTREPTLAPSAHEFELKLP